MSDANKLKCLGLYRYLYHCANSVDCYLPPRFAAGCKYRSSFAFLCMNGANESWAVQIKRIIMLITFPMACPPIGDILNDGKIGGLRIMLTTWRFGVSIITPDVAATYRGPERDQPETAYMALVPDETLVEILRVLCSLRLLYLPRVSSPTPVVSSPSSLLPAMYRLLPHQVSHSYARR